MIWHLSQEMECGMEVKKQVINWEIMNHTFGFLILIAFNIIVKGNQSSNGQVLNKIKWELRVWLSE